MHTLKLVLFGVVAASGALFQSTTAWSVDEVTLEAHCRLAYSQISDRTRSRVLDLITDVRGGYANEEGLDAFLEVCVSGFQSGWADDEDTYVFMHRDVLEVTSLECPSSERCLFTSIPEAIGVLRSDSASADEKLQTLGRLSYLTASLYQPLNLGYESDDQGRSISIEGAGACATFYCLWDEYLLAYYIDANGFDEMDDLIEGLDQIRATRIVTTYSHRTFIKAINRVYGVTTRGQSMYCMRKQGVCYDPRELLAANTRNEVRETEIDLVLSDLYMEGQSTVRARLVKEGGSFFAATIDYAFE